MKLRLSFLFILLFTFTCNIINAQVQGENIKLNQLGFYPYGPKVAVLTAPTPSNQFFVLPVNGTDTVFKGALSLEKQSAFSKTKTRIADFSGFEKSGVYVLYVPKAGKSYPFKIEDNANRQVAISSLKGFYYQRVSMPLEAKYAGKWARPAGHPDTRVLIHPSAASAERPAGTEISTPGGWYDAGDYNKYIVNSGITMGTLLSAYEDFPTYFDNLRTNIPESGNSIPDILNEALVNLRWMLSMQDPNDGGVYNKCTNATFDGMVMPGVTREPRYVVQKGTAATLDFAAVTAQASRIFRKYNTQLPGLADSCLKASIKAWEWAKKNPYIEYDQDAMNKKFQPIVTTGGYGDKKFQDEWFWASIELFVSTQEETYAEDASSNFSGDLSIPTWSDVQMMGVYTILRFRDFVPEYAKSNIDQLKDLVIQFADALSWKVSNNAFQTVMGQSVNDFNWGSNSNAANQGIVLINAYLITKNKKYLDNALSNLDYLLGRNATGYCFVTGIGSKSPMNPHHRASVADGIDEPVPGLMAGGPNSGMQDKCVYPFTDPELAYLDKRESYASNEIAINWNAPLVYLSNGIEALQSSVFIKR
jgi:endoglucanase